MALLAGLVCYGLIGRSRFAIVTATSSSAAVLASATLTLGGGDPALRAALASILVAGAGIAFSLAGGLRLGAMSNLIARPVLRGYAFGLALVIALRQWPLLVNLPVHGSDFLTLLAEIVRGAAAWQGASLGCGLARIELTPHLTAFVLPSGARWLALAEFSLALMFILYAESYGSIRTFALRFDEEVRPNRDLLALGVANIVCGLLQATPVGAGYSGTSANVAAGARSRRAGLLTAGVVLLAVLLFLRWIERIPQPALAAIVIHAVSKSMRPGVFRDYFRWRRDQLVVVSSVLAVMIFGVLNGLLVAIALSLAMLLKSLASPRLSVLGRVGAHDYVSVERYARAAAEPGMLILRPEAPLFFANAEPLLAQARALAAPGTKIVILSLEETPDLDSTALEALSEFCLWLSARGIGLRVARLKELAREALLRAQLPVLPAATLDYWSVDDAVRGERVSPDRAPGE